ncbi:MAG: hypothetical protein N3B21_06100 [Clostridia bacterium]|nr:hypothetical protein [Clostridia bacterium]
MIFKPKILRNVAMTAFLNFMLLENFKGNPREKGLFLRVKIEPQGKISLEHGYSHLYCKDREGNHAEIEVDKHLISPFMIALQY